MDANNADTMPRSAVCIINATRRTFSSSARSLKPDLITNPKKNAASGFGIPIGNPLRAESYIRAADDLSGGLVISPKTPRFSRKRVTYVHFRVESTRLELHFPLVTLGLNAWKSKANTA